MDLLWTMLSERTRRVVWRLGWRDSLPRNGTIDLIREIRDHAPVILGESHDAEPRLDIDTCAELLAPFVASHPAIKGPFETAYGFGFDPTITYWVEARRVHLHEDLHGAFCMEVADRSTKTVRRCFTQDISKIRATMEAFLVHGRPPGELPDTAWLEDGQDHDKFIPNPPNLSHPGNIASFLGGHGSGEVVAKQRPEMGEAFPSRRKRWWQFWR